MNSVVIRASPVALALSRRAVPIRIVSRASPTSCRSSLGVRFASSSRYYQAPEEKKGIKIGHLFAGLTLLGITATSYGLYQFYTTFTTFPNTASHPIRSSLRSALRSIATSSYPRASVAFGTAYDLALDLASTGQLGSREEALLKTTGIAVRWGGMWEDVGETGKAIEVYEKGWREVVDLVDGAKEKEVGGKGGASENEVMRGVAIGLKLGDLYVEVGGPDADRQAEKYYVWCVEEMLRLGMSDEQKQKVEQEILHDGALPTPEGEKEDLGLPKWLGKVELVAGFERLGELYTREGKVEYAQPLLQQAIATLLPPPPKDGSRPAPPPVPTRCHAATLMNNLSSTYVSDPSPSKEAIDQASRWARQALSVANQCRKEADQARKSQATPPLAEREEQECEMVALVGAYNLGKLAELGGDKVSAKAWFEKSRKQATRLGSKEGVQQNTEALSRL